MIGEGRNQRNLTYAYIGARKRCGACALKAQCTSGAFLSCHPHGRTSPATRTGVVEHARILEGAKRKKEGRRPVRATQESDRIAPLAPAEIEVRAGAVLSGSSSAEHQPASAIPQLADHAAPSHHVDKEEEVPGGTSTNPKRSHQHRVFQHPQAVTLKTPGGLRSASWVFLKMITGVGLGRIGVGFTPSCDNNQQECQWKAEVPRQRKIPANGISEDCRGRC